MPEIGSCTTSSTARSSSSTATRCRSRAVAQITRGTSEDANAVVVAPLPKLGDKVATDGAWTATGPSAPRTSSQERRSATTTFRKAFRYHAPESEGVFPKSRAPARPVRRSTLIHPPGWRNWSDAVGLKPAVPSGRGGSIPSPGTHPLPASSVSSRSAGASSSRQRVRRRSASASCPASVPGRFMRASPPRRARPATARSRAPARECHATLDQRPGGSAGSSSVQARWCSVSDSHQPTRVSLSCVPV